MNVSPHPQTTTSFVSDRRIPPGAKMPRSLAFFHQHTQHTGEEEEGPSRKRMRKYLVGLPQVCPFPSSTSSHPPLLLLHMTGGYSNMNSLFSIITHKVCTLCVHVKPSSGAIFSTSDNQASTTSFFSANCQVFTDGEKFPFFVCVCVQM